MFNLSNKFSKDLSPIFLGWIIFGWIIVLLFPLFQIVPNPATLSGHPWKVELVFSLFLASILILIIYKKDKIYTALKDFSSKDLSKILIPFLLFILWSGISIFWAVSTNSVAHHTLIWSSYFIFFILCLISIKLGKTLNIFIIPTAFVAIILCFLCIFDFLGVKDFASVEGTLRIRYAKFAEMIVTIAPLFWALAFYTKSLRKSYIYLLAGIGAWITVMFSLSRGAFLAGICGFIFFFITTLLFSRSKFRRKTFLFAGIWLAVTLIIQISFSVNSHIPSTSDYLFNKRNSAESSIMDAEDNTNMRIYTWKVSGQMISNNFLLGVGADNFGLEFNEARSQYALKEPLDSQNKIGEWFMFERAHNEIIQIFAELGIIGLALFISFVSSFIYFAIKIFQQNSYKVSPILLACISGMIAFSFSSMFSSFSFRAIQNGLVFFLVFAVAMNELLKIHKTTFSSKQILQLPFKRFFKPTLVLSLIVTLLLLFTSLKSGISHYYVYLAESADEFSNSEKFYQNAILFEKDNGSAYFSFGLKQLFKKSPENATKNLKIAIDKGLGVSSTYSYLATSQLMESKHQEAEQTMAKAVEIFPWSVFARVRYAVLLDQNGKTPDFEKQMEIARQINKNQADGWYYLIKKGSDETVRIAREEKIIPELSQLQPSDAMYAILDDEFLLNRFPENVDKRR